MIVDCDSCAVRGPACGGCVMTVLMGNVPAGIELDDAEQAALAVLADSGLIPPLRLVDASGGINLDYRPRLPIRPVRRSVS